MVGIVVVAHSQELAQGVCALASQMSARADLPIAAAGGLEDGSLGTSFDRIQQAVDAVYSDDGVLVLMDLGSAVMTTQMLLEMLSPERRERIRLSNAPLVEGAIAAAVAASLGDDLDKVQHAAETAMELPKIPQEAPLAPPMEAAPAPAGPSRSVELIVPNPVGLHARPAALFVQTAVQFKSKITVQNVSQNRQPVDAKSMMQVASQGTARQGERIRIVAQGDDADEAIAALRALVEAGFGEMEGVTAPPRLAPPPVLTLTVPSGPPPSRVQGIGASEGYAIAPAFVYRRPDLRVEQRPVDDPQAEINRFRQALDVASQQLDEIQQRVSAAADEQTGRIFEFHRMMLEDAELLRAVEGKIAAERCNAEFAVSEIISQWVNRFEGLGDELMRARAADVRDVGHRLLAILMGVEQPQLSRLPEPVIVVADDLVPSETALLDRERVRGLCTALGGSTSHTAILARMWGIPAVVGLGGAILTVSSGITLALDGETGVVEIDPSPETVNAYRTRQERLATVQAVAMERTEEPAVTRDGRQVEVVANIGDVDSAQEAIKYGAEGVGLLRTEFLYLERTTLPDEEEQFAAYRAIAEVMGQRPLIVRTLDVGGDKQLPYLDIGPELNPFLGVRAIRLCLERPDIFQPQLRAILRAGVGHNVKIMFPMVATREEILRAREALDQARRSLEADGVPFADQVEVGIMVETPAAAIAADILAPEVDFFSIGSNDLTQYTLAVDRGNERVGYLYHALDPAVLRLIRTVIEAGHAAGKWVGVCGEMAGQRMAIPILLGLGLDEFSMNPRAIPLAKHLIRQLEYRQAQALAQEVLALRDVAEVEARISQFLSDLEA
ncbi:MAG: phosphoenolpyruvate--protein phosphotransferase [Anaerolineae bacterium]|nr:phosphoenolpyruvate--protein phosphotransferase [Anaerolineae bacterium]MDH7472649.1 phosphoenolpyruvate--protein phosphotransferase [Anaerolineae bacterium]